MAETIVDVRGAAKDTPDGSPLLSNVSFSLAAGQSLALVGRSGSGKSTLLAALGLLDGFDKGTYELLGQSTSAMKDRERSRFRARTIGFVFQNFSLIPHLSVLENVTVAVGHLQGSPRAKAERAVSLLDALGIAHLSKRRPATLSGGQKQRTAIARALYCKPALVLADEPTGSLDIDTGEIVMSELMDMTKNEGAALIIVTHDLSNASKLDTIMQVADGSLSATALKTMVR